MSKRWIQSATVGIDEATGELWVAARGNEFVARDGSATPVASPVASGTAQISLTWPTNAIALLVRPIDTDVTLLDEAGASMTLPANTYFEIPGKAGDTTLINRPNATALEFAFEVHS